MKESVLIIGGGMGGLFTGAFLAREGHRVTVLEKNTIPGGGLQSFVRRGEIFDTGMHILGGFRPGGSLFRICSFLGIADKLSIRHTDEEAIDTVTYLSDGKTYSVPRGREAFTDYFIRCFPSEETGIRAYVEALYALADEIDLFHLRRGADNLFAHGEQFLWAADELIAHYVAHPKLRDVLAYMNPMYGGVSGHTPAYIHALINVLYIEGSSFFNDGSRQLAEALIGLIRDAGGSVHCGDPAVRIHVEDRRVTSVVTQQGRKYVADMYVSDIHPCTLMKLLPEEAFTRSYRNRLEEIPNSYSAFTVYIGFKKNTFPYINHPCYYQEDYGMVWNHSEYDAANWPRGFMYLTPPARDQSAYARKMIVNCIMDFDCVRRWEHTQVGRRGEDYKAWKQYHLQCVLNKLERLHPGIGEQIAYAFASSPLTIRDYYGVKEGALYGFRKDCRNIALSQVPIGTKVRNLLLTGQNINLHGICGVPLTALQTAEAIVGEGRIIDAINQMKDERTRNDN